MLKNLSWRILTIVVGLYRVWTGQLGGPLAHGLAGLLVDGLGHEFSCS